MQKDRKKEERTERKKESRRKPPPPPPFHHKSSFHFVVTEKCDHCLASFHSFLAAQVKGQGIFVTSHLVGSSAARLSQNSPLMTSSPKALETTALTMTSLCAMAGVMLTSSQRACVSGSDS